MIRYRLSEIYAAVAPKTAFQKRLIAESKPYYMNDVIECLGKILPTYGVAMEVKEQDGEGRAKCLFWNSKEPKIKWEFEMECQWSDILQWMGPEAGIKIACPSLAKEPKVFYYGKALTTPNGISEEYAFGMRNREDIDAMCRFISLSLPVVPHYERMPFLS